MKNQKGYGILEMLLLVVIVGIIGGVGYYVYTANKKGVKVSDHSIQGKEAIAKQDVDFVEIKEWRVQFKKPAGMEDTSYEYMEPESWAPAGSIVFITKYEQEFEKASAYEKGFGIYRYKAGTVVDSPGEEGFKIEDTYRAKNGQLELIDGYYYELHTPQDGSDDPALNAILDNQNQAAFDMYESLEAVEN